MKTLHACACLLALIACADPDDERRPDVRPADAALDAGADDADLRRDPDRGVDQGARDGSAPDAEPPDAAPPDADAAPLIAAALDCPPARSPDLTVRPGDDLMRATLADPAALCNDGTPAVLYVRAGRDAGAARWLIWLDSGGGCTSAAGCARRWCGNTAPNSPAKMSSRWAPAGIVGEGIFDAAPSSGTNDFADWNQVHVYYCSSDTWVGQIDHPRLRSDDGETPDYAIHFRGAAIVDATIDALIAGVRSDDGLVALPRLGDAQTVLFAGSSAGAGGVRMHADAVGDVLRAVNPGVDYRAVVDAGIWAREPGPFLDAEAAATYAGSIYTITRDFRAGRSDASCLAMHAADPSPCADSTHVMLHHMSTPYFAKMDLHDIADPGIYASVDDYIAAQSALLDGLARDTLMREEAGASPATGVYVPDCGHHIGLRAPEFYSIRVGGEAGGGPLSFHDVLSNWVRGRAPAAVVDRLDDALRSECP